MSGLMTWLLRAAAAFRQSRRLSISKREVDWYRAFTIGADGLAISAHVVAADCDSEALGAVMQLQGELRLELWCGSRKVADVPPVAR
jgi:hypothetical protein